MTLFLCVCVFVLPPLPLYLHPHLYIQCSYYQQGPPSTLVSALFSPPSTNYYIRDAYGLVGALLE